MAAWRALTSNARKAASPPLLSTVPWLDGRDVLAMAQRADARRRPGSGACLLSDCDEVRRKMHAHLAYLALDILRGPHRKLSMRATPTNADGPPQGVVPVLPRGSCERFVVEKLGVRSWLVASASDWANVRKGLRGPLYARLGWLLSGQGDRNSDC